MRMRLALSVGLFAIVLLAGSAHALGQDAFKPVVAGAVSPEFYAAPGSRPAVSGVLPPDWRPAASYPTPIPDVPETDRTADATVLRSLPFAPFTDPFATDEVQASAALPTSPGATARPWLLPLVGLVASAGAVLVMSRTQAKRVATPERTRTVPVLTPVGPDDVEGLLRNGQLAAQKGDLEEATAWFRQATSVAPTLAVAHFCHGTCLWGTGRSESAMRAYSRAVDLDPSDGAARIQLARVLLALGEAGEAMVVLAPVLRDVPEFMDVMRRDPDFTPLVDHPLFLAMAGVL